MSSPVEIAAQVVKAMEVLHREISPIDHEDLSHLPADWMLALSWMPHFREATVQHQLNQALVIFFQGLNNRMQISGQEWGNLRGILHGVEENELVNSPDRQFVGVIHMALLQLLEKAEEWRSVNPYGNK
jgi:hypothetical protein